VEKSKEVVFKSSPDFVIHEENDTPEFDKKERRIQLDINKEESLDFVKKKKDFYACKVLNDQRNNLRVNFHMYQKSWLDNLKECNTQYDRSKKELITLNRFKYKINEFKKFDHVIKVNDKYSVNIYQSDNKIESITLDE
jgi:hypothetical protein